MEVAEDFAEAVETADETGELAPMPGMREPSDDEKRQKRADDIFASARREIEAAVTNIPSPELPERMPAVGEVVFVYAGSLASEDGVARGPLRKLPAFVMGAGRRQGQLQVNIMRPGRWQFHPMMAYSSTPRVGCWNFGDQKNPHPEPEGTQPEGS